MSAPGRAPQRRGRLRRDGGRSGRMTRQCFRRCCRRFVSRPSAVCAVCGNDPVPLPGHVNETQYRDLFDYEHGWDPYEAYR